MLFMLLVILLLFVGLLAWDIVEYLTGQYELNKYIHKQSIKSDVFFIGLTLGCIVLQYLL